MHPSASDPGSSNLPSESDGSSLDVCSDPPTKPRQIGRRRRNPPPWVLKTARSLHWLKRATVVGLPNWLQTHRAELTSYLFSLLFLSAVALMMALWVLPPNLHHEFFGMLVTQVDREQSPPLEIVELIDDRESPDSLTDLDLNSNMKPLQSDFDDGFEPEQMDSINDGAFAVEFVPTDTEMETIYRQGEFGGRSKAGRQMSVRKFGGSVESEKAVNSGLQWLQKIQLNDGSWNFSKVSAGAKAGSFRRTEIGATSLALLCFLGAGHTHMAEGPYQETVRTGLAFIGKEATVQQGTADLRGSYEGNAGMYVHALATICISEAHALERHDRDLTKLTEMAVAFIESAQDPLTGGWRYKPRDDSEDTSVVAWQVMALQSAKSGRIRFSSKSLRLARDYLNSAQTDSIGSQYSYVPGRGGSKPTMTAAALLCRMYLGWQRDHAGLKAGVAAMSTRGPIRGNIYYNYYATQVMHHWGGESWTKWNRQMRTQLVNAQLTDGPAAGSWPTRDPHAKQGGQLYQTALSVLTLEVYYRHLPIYKQLAPVMADED